MTFVDGFTLGMAAGIALSMVLLYLIRDRQIDRLREAKATLESQFRLDTPWPVSSIIEELLFAAEVLLKDYNYDQQGYENIIAACDAARALRVNSSRSTVASG